MMVLLVAGRSDRDRPVPSIASPTEVPTRPPLIVLDELEEPALRLLDPLSSMVPSGHDPSIGPNFDVMVLHCVLSVVPGKAARRLRGGREWSRRVRVDGVMAQAGWLLAREGEGRQGTARG